MGKPNSRGQSAIEVLVLLLFLTSLVLAAFEFSQLTNGLFHLHQLSVQETR